MSEKIAKRLRKEARRLLLQRLGELRNITDRLPVMERIGLALDIVFKLKKKI